MGVSAKNKGMIYQNSLFIDTSNYVLIHTETSQNISEEENISVQSERTLEGTLNLPLHLAGIPTVWNLDRSLDSN